MHLWDNNISDISLLASLTNLELLRLATNNISDISALSNLTKPSYLSLWDNNINDISALADLKDSKVRLKDNELNSDAYSIHNPALEAKGISVQYDEQEPWDVASDGIVNIFDFVLVTAQFGE